MMGLDFLTVKGTEPEILSEIQAHYTGARGVQPGKRILCLAHDAGQPIAVLGLGLPPYKLAARKSLGLLDSHYLPHTVCCFIFRRIGSHPAKGSEILRSWHEWVSNAWSEKYGWTPLHWETLIGVDLVQSANPGSCYRKAGYRSIGPATSFGTSRPMGGMTTRPGRKLKQFDKLAMYRGPLHKLDPCLSDMRRIAHWFDLLDKYGGSHTHDGGSTPHGLGHI